MAKNDPLAESRAQQAAAVAAQEENDKIQPTPTQDELDRARLGLVEDDDDVKASARQPVAEKATEAAKPATYQTRSAGKND